MRNVWIYQSFLIPCAAFTLLLLSAACAVPTNDPPQTPNPTATLPPTPTPFNPIPCEAPPAADPDALLCDGLGLGSATAIAATPRANQNLELLSLAMAPGVTARQEIYDRVLRDIELIRSTYADVAEITFWEDFDGSSLILHVDAATHASMSAGAYTAWDCLNNWYGLINTSFSDPVGGQYQVQINLNGVFDTALLQNEYAQLPGVTQVTRIPKEGFAPTICGAICNGVHHYVFDNAQSLCEEGCKFNDFYHFSVEEGGQPVLERSWTGAPGWEQPPMLSAPLTCH